LAVEVKNPAKKALNFNTTTVFLHDVMVSENDVLEDGAFGVFSWVTLSSDCRYELQYSESEPSDRQREFRKSLLCSTVCICSHTKIHFNK